MIEKLKNRVVIIVPLYNVKDLIIDCLNSIINQSYEDIGIIIRDDLSNDGTSEIIKNFLNIDSDEIKIKFKNKDIIYVKNKLKLYPVGNTYESVIDLVENKNSIIGVVDGDDFLVKNDAIEKIVKIYDDNDVWMVWSQHKKTNGVMGESKPLPTNNTIYSNRNYWSVTHFRTCLSFLYHKLDKQDLLDPFVPNSYFTFAGDAALLFPFCEMCGQEKSFFLNEILYHYNNTLPSNEHNKNMSNAIRYGSYIRNYQKRYQRILTNE